MAAAALPDTTIGYAAVVVSAFTHAYWNYLLKRSGGGQLFVGLSKIGEVVLCAPLFVLVILGSPSLLARGLPLLAVVGATLTLANYVFLAFAYDRGELSLVYPVARGGVLLFLPIAGWVVYHERLSTAGIVAVVLILAGIIVLQLPTLSLASLASLARRLATSSATGFALAAALAAAGYTIWDKHAVHSLTPFAYFFSYTTLVALAYGIFIARKYERSAVVAEWHRNYSPILQVAVLNTITYLLVLVALRDGVTSYVVALRQLSIGVGAFLGWKLLGEEFGVARRVGVALLLCGCALVALAL